LLFDPLARRLTQQLDAIAVITVRDNAQTLSLARERWPDATVIGGPTPVGWGRKARAMAGRALGLVRWARETKPDVALSHNSYGQLLAARMLGIPSVTAMDYEFQPANHVGFRAASRILLPEAVPPAVVRRQGAAGRKVTRYPGIKEELYIGDFTPDPQVLSRLGVERGDGTRLVVLRTPPSGAAYHRFGNPLFVESLRILGSMSATLCVVLARNSEDRREVDALGLENCVIPNEPVDARSLMREADLVLGAGGTMTREAAVMGIPTYSVFRGPRPAVDAWLERRGALRFLESPRELQRVPTRPKPPADLEELRARGRTLQEVFVRSVEDVAAQDRGGSR
jgi:predicted glycosyltransferase